MLFHHLQNQDALVQERVLRQEYELKKFDHFMKKKLKDVPKNNLMEVFEREWSQAQALNTDDWREFRGSFGETVLHLVCLRRVLATGDEREQLDEILFQMMARGASLIGIPYDLEPYIGENLLHMLVADSDVEMVKVLLGHLKRLPDHQQYLDARASGKFFQHLVSSPMEPKDLRDTFVTPLSVALLAPQEDDIALALVEILVHAGCSTDFRDEHNVIHSTVMHHLAKCRWNHGVDYQGRSGAGGFISLQRMHRLFDLLTSGERMPKVNLSTRDCRGNNALQLAAIIGNGEYIKMVIKQKAVRMWQWGQTIDYRFPLDGIDTGGPNDHDASVMELLAVHNHKKTLSYGIFVAILEDKWSRYGYKLLVFRFLCMLTIVVLITLANAFTNSVDAGIRDVACYTALSMSIVGAIYLTFMFAWRCRSSWFWKLHWLPFMSKRFHGSIWGLGVINDWLVLILAVVVCIVQIWKEHLLATGHVALVEYQDEFSSVLVFLGWFRLLRLLALFQVTGVMVSSLPRIFLKDVLPFAMVLIVFTMASACAIRVATAHTISHNDEIIGTFWKSVAALEESVHGPDVNWRSVVHGKPLIAVISFLVFLWVATIVLFNILIAMFTNTFQETRKRHMEEHNLKWCGEIITQEKFIPSWLWKLLSLDTGMPMQAGHYGTHSHHSSAGFDEEHGRTHSGDASATSPLLGKEVRWLSVEQIANNETWDKPVNTWKARQ